MRAITASFVWSAVLLVGICFTACDAGDASGDDEAAASSGSVASADASDPVASVAPATLSGRVTRTAAIQDDGIGDLYVALFDSNPVDLSATAEPLLVSQVVLADQDLNAEDSGVTYLLEDIPPRAGAYFVITFFDDNDTIDPTAPGPDKGDLVSLDGLSAFEVVIDASQAYERDLVLNIVMPL